MNTTHIKSFLYVSKYNSISKAAEKLNYSTSTIYEHLKALENEVGVSLYNKTNRGVYLTENGELFLGYANKIIDIVDDVHRRFGKSNELLRITASETSDFFVMKPLLDKFITKYPYIEIDYTKAITDTAIEKILNGLSDIGVICEPNFSTSRRLSFSLSMSMVFIACVAFLLLLNQNLVRSLKPSMVFSPGKSHKVLFGILTPICTIASQSLTAGTTPSRTSMPKSSVIFSANCT